MSDPKKNPLIGAFHTPAPDKSPPKSAEAAKDEKQRLEAFATGKAAEEKTTAATPAVSAKSGEDRKPDEASKASEEKKPVAGEEKAKDGKTPAVVEKPGEEQKSAEQPKGKDEKKPAEGEKKLEADKLPATPAKPDEGKKTTEPPKDGGEKKADESEEIPADLKLEILSQGEMVTETSLPIDLIDDMEGHPFFVKDDKDMQELVTSIKQVGILEPVTVIRNPKKLGRFIMVSGHRRKHGAKLAGHTHIRAFVRNMDYDEAIIAMVDSNLKRDKISPMEKARAYQMKSDALRRKAGRRSKEETAKLKAAGIKPMTADQELAEQTGESVASVQRIKTLNKLTEPLQEMVDKGEIPVNTAVDIAQMKPEEQNKLADAIEKEGGTVPSGTKAKELKEESKAGTLTEEKIEASVAPTKHELNPPLKVTLVEEDLRPYFPGEGVTIPDVKRGVFEALDLRKKALERQKAKAEEAKAAAKKAPVRNQPVKTEDANTAKKKSPALAR